MLKITFIGAGSLVFAKKLIIDILSFPELRESTICLMDIDKERLRIITMLARRIVNDNHFSTKIESTIRQKRALEGADFVIAMFEVGGLKARELDIEIPQKYGVCQAIGDTLGPGGIFKGLRLIPRLLHLTKDMEDICPNALLMNYTNPMAINCRAIEEASKIKYVGLCHGLEESKKFLAKVIGVPYPDISCKAAGINHMAWILELNHNGKDLYPVLREKIKDREIFNLEPIRFEFMEVVGYFMTESSYHTAEYLPYFKDRFADLEVIPKEKAEHIPKEKLKKSQNWGLKEDFFVLSDCEGERELRVITGWDVKIYQKITDAYFNGIKEEAKGKGEIRIERSVEYASRIIHSIHTGTVRRINGNVANNSLIANLPEGCCVEVPCLVDEYGIHPVQMGNLPSICAGLNRSNINVQELVVKGTLNKDRKYIYQAAMVDPLSSSILSLPKIKKMIDEMFEAESEYIDI